MAHKPVHSFTCFFTYCFSLPDHYQQFSHLPGCCLSPAKTFTICLTARSTSIYPRMFNPVFSKPFIDCLASAGKFFAPYGGHIITMGDHQADGITQVYLRAVFKILNEAR